MLVSAPFHARGVDSDTVPVSVFRIAMAIDVFVSVGRTATAAQEKFVQAFEQFMHEHGLSPQMVGRNKFGDGPPLKTIDGTMNTCAGTIVLAFERTCIESGVEMRGGGPDREKAILQARLPTVWNQIEAAMAYAFRKPLLVVVERGLRAEGLLEAGYDWYVLTVDVNDPASSFADKEVRGVFDVWKRRVESTNQSPARRELSPEQIDELLKKVPLLRILRALSLPQFAAIFGIVVALVSTAAGAGYWLAQRLPVVAP